MAKINAKQLKKLGLINLNSANDDILLRCAKQAGFDDIHKFDDIWDANVLSSAQRKKIIAALNNSGWDRVKGDEKWVELVNKNDRNSTAENIKVEEKKVKNSPAMRDIKSAIAKLKKVKAVQTYITLAKRTARLYEAMNNSKKPKDNMPAIKANKAKMAKLAKMKSVSTLIKLVKKQSKLLGVV